MIDPRFELIDHDGCRVDETAFRGRFTLVFFGLTKCPVVCPRALTKISEALELVGDVGEGINALYITVDPEADSPETMSDFIRAWLQRADWQPCRDRCRQDGLPRLLCA